MPSARRPTDWPARRRRRRVMKWRRDRSIGGGAARVVELDPHPPPFVRSVPYLLRLSLSPQRTFIYIPACPSDACTARVVFLSRLFHVIRQVEFLTYDTART